MIPKQIGAFLASIFFGGWGGYMIINPQNPSRHINAVCLGLALAGAIGFGLVYLTIVIKETRR